MWIVRIALDRPYTFVVLALLILIASPVVIARTPTDIFPSINIPVIAVAWQYSGLNAEELEGRITTSYERVLTTTVDNIQRIERADPAARPLGGGARRAAALRPGRQLPAAAARDHSRRRHPVPVRGQAAAGHGGSQHPHAAGQGA